MVYNNYSKNDSNFISPIYTFSLAGNINAYMQSQGKNREKYFNHIEYKLKNADYGGKQSPFHGCVFSIFRPKMYKPNLS